MQKLEDELERSCNIKAARELTGSRTISEYKKALNAEKNLGSKLTAHAFDIDSFWNKDPNGAFEHIINEAAKVKL